MKQNKIFSYLGLCARARNLCSGEFAVEKAVKEEKAILVFVAEDASDNTKKHFADMCVYREIPYVFYGTKEDLGHCIGKDLRSSVAVLDAGIGNAILKELENETNHGGSK